MPTSHRRPRQALRVPLLPMSLGARPATALKLVAAIGPVPTVGSPFVSAARAHRMTANPHMLIVLPGPVSRSPRITTVELRNDFNAWRRRSNFDNDTARDRRSGGNATDENQRQQHASHSPAQRAIRLHSSTACSPRQRGTIRCRSHGQHLGRKWKSHSRDDLLIASAGRCGSVHTHGDWF